MATTVVFAEGDAVDVGRGAPGWDLIALCPVREAAPVVAVARGAVDLW